MLDGLDKVDWDQLTHAYGTATDLPDLLRSLTSDQKEVFDNALWELYPRIRHQGTVYEATAYTVPFLIELLEVPSVVCKAEILRLLQAVASGSSYLDVHQDLDWYRNVRKTEQFQAERQRELDWVRAAHVAVLQGTSVYIGLLSHSEVSVRVMAPYVLATCVERISEIEPALRRRFATDGEPEVKASSIMALANLWCHTRQQDAQKQPMKAAEQQNYFANILRSPTESPIVRFVASLSSVESGGEQFVGEALCVFRETVEAYCGVYSRWPWRRGSSPLFAASSALSSHPDVQLQWLLQMLGHRNAELREAAIWEIGEMCRERRSTPQAVAPQDPDEVLPVLLEELQCRPAGLLVADCLGEMGHRAQAAIPALRRIIESEVRLGSWVDEDEAFCEAAQGALERIQSDVASQQ